MDILNNGPLPAAEVLKLARTEGICGEVTLRRAAIELKVKKGKEGFQGRWMWSLDSQR